MTINSRERIITPDNIDDTLIEVCPVRTSIEKVTKKDDDWRVAIIFKYNGQNIYVYTEGNFKFKTGSATNRLYEGKKLLNGFLEKNNLFISFPKDQKTEFDSDLFSTKITSIRKDGTAYVPVVDQTFKTKVLESYFW